MFVSLNLLSFPVKVFQICCPCVCVYTFVCILLCVCSCSATSEPAFIELVPEVFPCLICRSPVDEGAPII